MITFLIIGFTSFISYKAFNSSILFHKAKFSAYNIKHLREYERIISHLFIHANWEHLIFNMLTLFFFGSSVETVFNSYFGAMGTAYYIALYLMGGVFASIYSLMKQQNNPNYSAVGASGAVSAILFASILLNPLSKIYLFFIPIGIPAYIFGPFYLFYSIYMDKKGNDNVGHDAHFWGAIFGLAFPLFLNFDFLFQFFEAILN